MSDINEKYLLFEVDEEYALELGKILEIIELCEITRVPETPEYIAGIINLRGHVIPVIDVRKRFRKPPKDDIKQQCIVIAVIEGNQIGLIVDNVIDLIDIESGNVKDSPQVGGNYINVFVKAIGVTEGKMHLIVDTDRLVNFNDLFFLENGGEAAEKTAEEEI